jgi:segregation and condensation protein B
MSESLPENTARHLEANPTEQPVEQVAEPAVAPDAELALNETPIIVPPDEDALRLAEALVFASANPVTPRALSQVLAENMDAAAVLAALRTRYEGRGVELVEVGGGVQFRTAADLAPRLRKVVEVPRRLPRVAMETLAIIAYHQPVTRPEIEEIRGASLSQQTLDALLEAELIAPKGRKEAPGRPTLWATTPGFLAQFGLKDLREMPRREDLLVEPLAPREPVQGTSADAAPQALADANEAVPPASPAEQAG